MNELTMRNINRSNPAPKMFLTWLRMLFLFLTTLMILRSLVSLISFYILPSLAILTMALIFASPSSAVLEEKLSNGMIAHRSMKNHPKK